MADIRSRALRPLKRVRHKVRTLEKERRITKAVADMKGATVAVSCQLCDGTQHEVVRKVHGLPVVRCPRDGLLFASPRPVDVAPFYASGYYQGGLAVGYADYSAMADENRSSWEQRLDRIEAAVPLGRMLDVGSATGEMLALAQKRGWDVQGVELSEWAAEQANEHGVPTINGSLPDPSLPAGFYDAVTLWDCIEHLTDPLAVLVDVHRVARPGALVVLTTGHVPDGDPDSGRYWFDPPWHLWYFSQRTLGLLVERAGFTVADVSFEGERPAEIVTLTARH